METQGPTTKQFVQKAIQSNLAIQNALTAQATRLETQLKQLDELIEGVHKGVATEEVPEEAFEGEIQIPGSKRVNGPIASFELLSQSSPFYKEASQRAHYVRWTTVHPIKGTEAEVLADAVRKENMRLEAYRARDNPTAPPIDIENNLEGVNWSIVAEKVTDKSPIKRTPDECRIQWAGNLHPKVNHGDWTQGELNRLHELTAVGLATGEKIDWTKIAKDLGTNRIPIECMKQATTRPRHHWDAQADERLREAVRKFGTNNWNLVARYISPYATTSQCQTRYVRSVDPSIKRGPWTPEEDTRLRKAVEAFNNSWVDVASMLPGRTNEQCRERWAEIGVNEGGKGPWSTEEDQRLLDAVKELGNKWKMVSGRVGGGRTGPNCRLRYDRLMKTRAKQAETAATPAARSSRTSDPKTSPMPAGAPASISHPPSRPPSPDSVPAPTPTAVPHKPKSRPRRKSKAKAPPMPNSESQRGDPGLPPTEISAESAPQRLRPKPRPTYKGRGKEQADPADIARMVLEEQRDDTAIVPAKNTSGREGLASTAVASSGGTPITVPPMSQSQLEPVSPDMPSTFGESGVAENDEPLMSQLPTELTREAVQPLVQEQVTQGRMRGKRRLREAEGGIELDLIEGFDANVKRGSGKKRRKTVPAGNEGGETGSTVVGGDGGSCERREDASTQSVGQAGLHDRDHPPDENEDRDNGVDMSPLSSLSSLTPDADDSGACGEEPRGTITYTQSQGDQQE